MKKTFRIASVDQIISYDGNVFDLAKFILAIMIVCIHTQQLPPWLNPIFRLAVPLFFLLSSYFFFGRIADFTNREKLTAFRRFLSRNLKLFLFWTIVLIYPIATNNASWFDGWQGIVRLVRDAVFCDTFKGSWFLMALLQSVTLVFYCSRWLSTLCLLLIAFSSYTFCCLSSNYLMAFTDSSSFITTVLLFRHILGEPYLSFLSAFIWIVLGKLIAENSQKVNYYAAKFSFTSLLFLIAVFVSILFGEHFLISTKINSDIMPPRGDCYFGLLPVSLLIFLTLIKMNGSSIVFPKILRTFSTIIFCIHGAILGVVNRWAPFPYNYLTIPLVILSCCILAWWIFCLSRKRYLSFLKFAF